MLHGDIKVNDRVIGEWTAVRKERVHKNTPTPIPHEPIPLYYRYECTFNYNSIDGYNYRAEFDMVHRYGGGAALLASRVIITGYDKMVRVPVSPDEETMKIFQSKLK